MNQKINTIRIIMCMIFVYTIPSVVMGAPNIATPYYNSFEDETPNTSIRDIDCQGFDIGSPDDNCTLIYRHSSYEYTPRYGDMYLEMRCEYYTSQFPGSTQKSMRAGNASFEGFHEGSSCHTMYTNDGTEYWISFSNYIPIDYMDEMFKHAVVQIGADSPPSVVFAIQYGAGNEGSPVNTDSRWSTHIRGESNHVARFGDWHNQMGEWVDWVIHVRWYDTDHANAKFELFQNGISVLDVQGESNIIMGGHPIFTFDDYNWAYHNALNTGPNDTDISHYDEDHFRATYVDEFRFHEQVGGLGDSNYCSVAPPIIPEKSSMTYPTNNATTIPTNPTIRYNEYTDNRNDPQNCFSRASTHIQIDEQGENWSTPVYENTNAGNASQEITGLSNNTQYQVRVRHKNNRSGSTDEYYGDWSDINIFTTQTGSTSIRADVDQQNGINSTDAMLTLRNSLSLDMSQTAWQESATTGDVNCDGTSNSTDAMLILRHSVGLSMSGTGWCV